MLEPVQSQPHGGVQARIHQRNLLGGVTGLVDEGTAGDKGMVMKSILMARGIRKSQSTASCSYFKVNVVD